MFHVEQLSIADNMYNSKLIFNIVKNSFQNIEKYKEQNNFLSFADIINDTLLLLESDKNKDSILYTLNKKIHHLIIDESQDNSQKQWNIVKILFENLFIERHKSIFIVGDVKQSIYKFQGAQPEYFNLMKIFFQNKAQEWQKRFYFIEWNFSFRMPQTISTYVDNFFNSNGFSKYLTSQKNFMLEHISLSSNVPRGTSFYRINKKIKSARICSMWNIRSKISKSFMEKKLFHMEQFKRSLYRKKNISHTNNASKKQKMFHMEHCLIKLIKKLKAQEFVPCGTFVQKFLNPLWGKNCSTWNEPQAVKIETNQTLLNLVMTKNQNHSMMILFRSRNQIMKRLIEELRQKQIPIKYNLYENIIEHNTTKIILLINEILINYREQNNLQIQLLSQLLNNNTQEIQRLLLKIQNTSIKNIYNVTIKIIINCFNNNLDPIIVTKLLEIAEKLKNQNLHSIQSFNHFLYQNKIEVLLRSKDDSKITISTVHGSKGLESDIVIIADDILKQTIHEKFYFNLKKKTFILLKNKNCFYIDFFKNQLYYEEYEENMRLFYVAMTRAKKTLIFLNDAPRRTNSCAIDDF